MLNTYVKDTLKIMASILGAFGDANRLNIIKMPASNRGNTLCVSDVAARLGITQPAASPHIKVLKNIGVLEENKKGYRVFYTINNAVFINYKKEVDDLFIKAFEKCTRNFSCADCPDGKTCGKSR